VAPTLDSCQIWNDVGGNATARWDTEIAARFEAEAVRREQCVVFAMGQQDRLGTESWVRWLDPGVVQMVLEQV